MKAEINTMDQVLDLANRKCQERYLMTLYEKCGLKVSNIETLKKMLPLEETRVALSKGTIDFLDNLPAVSTNIAREILGVRSLPSGAATLAAISAAVPAGVVVAAGALAVSALRRKEVEDMLRQLFTTPQLFNAYGKVQEHMEDGGRNPQAAADELLLLLDL